MSVIIRLPQGGGGADTSVVTAGAGDVLSGKVIVNSAGTAVTGTMANQGAVSQSLNAGGSYTIPAGYHNGSGKVTANSLASQTDGTAYPGQILSGKTAWARGEKLEGTMPHNGAVSQTLDAGGSYTIPAGYHNGEGKVTAKDMKSQTAGTATAAQILSGQTAYVNGEKVTGTMANKGKVTGSVNAGGSYTIPAGYHDGTGTVTGNSLASQTDGTATAAQILSGQTAYVDGSKVTGTMANQGAKTSSLNAGGSYTIPAGYHNGSGKVTANDLKSQTSADATAANILINKTAWVNGTKITGTMPNKGVIDVKPKVGSQNKYDAGYYTTIYSTYDVMFKEENIKKGVTMFGVAGTYEGSGGTGKYIKTTKNLTVTPLYENSGYSNVATSYKATVPIYDSSVFTITSGHRCYGVVYVLFTKSITGHYGGSSNYVTNGLYGHKFFFVYDGKYTNVYAYNANSGASYYNANDRITNIETKVQGYPWGWTNSHSLGSAKGATMYPVKGNSGLPNFNMDVRTTGSTPGAYYVTVANVSAKVEYEIFTY